MPVTNSTRKQLIVIDDLSFDYGFFTVAHTGYENQRWIAPWHRFRPKQILFKTLEKSGRFILDIGVGDHPSSKSEDSVSRYPLWVEGSVTISTFDEEEMSFNLQTGFHNVWLSQWRVPDPIEEFDDWGFRFLLTFQTVSRREPKYESTP